MSERKFLRLLALSLLVALAGCSSRNSRQEMHSHLLPISSVSASIAQVQATPLYEQAKQACSRKQYLQAAHLLEILATTPGLNAEEVAFCNEQRDICLKDAGLLPKPTVTPAPVAPPRPAAEADCGPRALALACRQLDLPASVAELRQWAGTTAEGTTMAGLAKAAQKAGLKTEGVQVTQEGLSQIDTPAIAWVRRQHYVVVTAVRGEGKGATATIHDPNAVKEETMPQESLRTLCGGYLLLLHR